VAICRSFVWQEWWRRVAKNRCELTLKGCEALEQLLKLVYPDGYTETAINDDTGLARDTWDKIFDMLCGTQKPLESVQYVKLEQLFDRLNSKLDDQDKEKHKFQPRYCKEVNRSVAIKQQKVSPVVSTIPPKKQLATRLGSLNYTTGQATFNESMNRLKPAGAFLLQVGDTKVQRWLVRRLAQQVLGFENGRRLEINVACLGGNFESLWSELAGQLKLSHRTAEATIASLSELCQGKTVIIVLSRFQQLDEEMQRRLMGEFWLPLVRQIRSQPRDWRSRLVLFLIQDGAGTGEISRYSFEVVSPDTAQEAEFPVRLEPLLQITSHDVKGWFEQEGYELLAAQIGLEEADKFMQQDQISDWEQHPWITLENICNVFRTEITEIEPYWKLAG
jgi:hypothetical protein